MSSAVSPAAGASGWRFKTPSVLPGFGLTFGYTLMCLGLVVLLGVPVLMLLVGPVLRPLQSRTAHQRGLMSDLANTATDIVGCDTKQASAARPKWRSRATATM